MDKLSSVLAEILADRVAKSSAVRQSVIGVPLRLCHSLLDHVRVAGLAGKLLLLYDPRCESGLVDGVLATQLNPDEITKIRNTDRPYVMLVPEEEHDPRPDSIDKTAAILPDLVDDVEDAFWTRLGLGRDREWLKKFVLEAAGSSERLELERVRWHFLVVGDELISSYGWGAPMAFAAAVGLPPESAGRAFPDQEAINVLRKLSKFMDGRSPQQANDAFEELLKVPGRFDAPERVRAALEGFWAWLTRVGAVSPDWKSPWNLYRHRAGYPAMIGEEAKWRQVLDRETWAKLLSRFTDCKALEIDVLDAVRGQLPCREDGGSGFVIVDRKFSLRLRENHGGVDSCVVRKSRWSLTRTVGKMARETEQPIEETLIEIVDSGDWSSIFESMVVATPLVEAPRRPQVKLVNLESHELGVILYIDHGEIKLDEIIRQPATTQEDELEARVTIAEPGNFTLHAAYDAARWRPCYARLDGDECGLHQDMDGNLAIRVNADGQEQLLTLGFEVRDGKTVALSISIQCGMIKPGDFRSHLHYMSACHAASRRLPARLDTDSAIRRGRLLSCAFHNDHGFGGVLVVDEPIAASELFVQVPGTPFLSSAQSQNVAAVVASGIAAWELPFKVREARSRLIKEIKGFGAKQPVEALDFSREPLASTARAYLTTIDCWVNECPKEATHALEWMEAIHVVVNSERTHQQVAIVQLPIHPLRLRGLCGLSQMLEPRKGSKERWFPPLSRLYAMAGPRVWVHSKRNRNSYYNLVSQNEHYYPVYEIQGSDSSHLRSARQWLENSFSLNPALSSISMSAEDVGSIMDDVCSLNPAMAEFTVDIASDPLGEVTDGVFKWYFESEDDDSAPEFADWADCSPMNLRVYSRVDVIDQHDVNGRSAHYADSPGRRLMWHRVDPKNPPTANFSIFGQLETSRESSIPDAEAEDFPSTVSLNRLGACWKHDYLTDPLARIYAETFGNGWLDGQVNDLSSPGGAMAHALLGKWQGVLKMGHRFHRFADFDIQSSLENAQFVALPIGNAGDLAAAAGLQPDAAVWKFEQCAFGVSGNVSGHVILTQKLDFLKTRFAEIIAASGIGLPIASQPQVMAAMGKAGINTLHALSDNETVLLGAVTSLAVMRTYPAMPFHGRDGADQWPSLLLPLDPYDKMLKQLRVKKRPDFLCFDIGEREGVLDIQISILESKWRSQRQSVGHMALLLNDQCREFRSDIHDQLIPAAGDETARLSAALLLAELIAASIRIREQTHPEDVSFAGVCGAKRITQIVHALLNDQQTRVRWAQLVLVCVGPEFTTAIAPESADGFLATMAVADAASAILDPSYVVNWPMSSLESPPAEPPEKDAPSTRTVRHTPQGAPVYRLPPAAVDLAAVADCGPDSQAGLPMDANAETPEEFIIEIGEIV